MAPFAKERPTILHVGFAHSGTTSLQENLFSRRPDFLYSGIPYGELGGIFSFIKYLDARSYSTDVIDALTRKLIWNRAKPDQTIVVSDETLIEQPESYYTPHMQPPLIVAVRLRQVFPNAKVLFTIRNQFDYVTSSYLNLKRDVARMAQRPIETFSAWFAGNHTQVANLFLRNLDFSLAIKDYVDVFGRAAISVLPLELLQRQGAKRYLDQLARMLDIRVSDEDVARFSDVRNRRMTVLEDAIVTQWSDAEFRRTYEMLAGAVGHDQMADALRRSDPVRIALTESEIDLIRQRVGRGNRWIAEEFDIPLQDYGYPMATQS